RDAGGKPPIGIARGDADGLGAEIEADERAARRKMRGRLDQRQNERGHGTVPAGNAVACFAMAPAVVSQTRSSACSAIWRRARAKCLKRCGQPTRYGCSAMPITSGRLA